MRLVLKLDADTPRGDYLAAAARLRGISRWNLVHKLVDKVLDDQLILAVLDDDGERRRPSARIGARQRARQAGRLMARKLQRL
jgi:hypothetical protein